VLLSDRDIKAEIESGRVKLDPYEPELIQPASIDVRLDRYFRVFENHRYPHIDPAIEQADLTRLVETEGDDPFVLHPGEFVLGSTFEVISLPDDIAGRLEGKSSLGRLGLLTHSTAGWIDPGFSGHVTLELSNVATLPIKLWPGMKIGQLCLFRTSSPAEHPYGSSVYGSRYQDQRGPTPSKSYLNFYRSKVWGGPAPLTSAVLGRHAPPRRGDAWLGISLGRNDPESRRQRVPGTVNGERHSDWEGQVDGHVEDKN
jgi:dCTP deaminase